MLNDFFHNAFKLALLLSNFSFADVTLGVTISFTTLLATCPAAAWFALFIIITASDTSSFIGSFIFFSITLLITLGPIVHSYFLYKKYGTNV